jgi:hypothetical protein
MTPQWICDKTAARTARAVRGHLPFTTFVLLAFGMGAAAALAGAHELRVSPRPVLLSDSFAAFVAFLLLLVLPVSLYFYAFHGDWFMLYLVEVKRIPAALALVGFTLELAVGLLGFGCGALCVRAQRSHWVIAALFGCVIAGVSVLFTWPERLLAVGSFRQYRGGFGLTRYGGPLMHAALAMGGLLAVGATFLIVRIRRGQGRLQRPGTSAGPAAK